MPKAITRQRKKRNSESEDEDFVADEEVTSKKKVIKKEQVAAAGIKPGMKKKAPAQRKPMSKVRASTQETMEFTLEPREEEAAGGKKRKERVKKTIAKVIGKPSMTRDDEEAEEERDLDLGAHSEGDFIVAYSVSKEKIVAYSGKAVTGCKRSFQSQTNLEAMI